MVAKALFTLRGRGETVNYLAIQLLRSGFRLHHTEQTEINSHEPCRSEAFQGEKRHRTYQITLLIWDSYAVVCQGGKYHTERFRPGFDFHCRSVLI